MKVHIYYKTLVDKKKSGTKFSKFCRHPGLLTLEPIQRSNDLMENLQNCHIDNADVFLALSGNDNENVMAAQIASRIFNVPIVICHINEASKYNAYKEMGLNVVSSSVMVSGTILQTLKGKS